MKAFVRFVYFNIVVVMVVSVASCGSTQRAFRNAEPQMPFDVVIVPGVPFDTAWSDVMRMRVLWSYYLYNRGYTKNIIFSGSAVYTPYIESRIMAEYAEKLGIPAEHIFTEERAEHSTENVFYSYYMAKDLGFRNIALATDPFQTKMVKSFAKKKKLDIAYVPAIFDTIHAYYADVTATIDPTWAEVDNFVALPEREGFWKRFAGTMGKNLKYTPDQITDASMKYDDLKR
ncbi:MAG: YdcF family protein [Flavobacteriales bacterium]|nr:YdcF family protein [Flavobacteriales bacterium]